MPVVGKYAYFDHAAVAPLPAPASTAMQQYALEACEHGDAIWPTWSKKVKTLRENAARLLNVDIDEIALVNSTTQGINFVAEGIPWQEGDNVLVPENEFPSNMLPWYSLSRLGVEVRTIPVPSDGAIGPDLFRPFMDGRTRLIALSWVGYSSGYRVDVGSIVELARNFGPENILVALDAIQGLGAFPLDARQLDLDFVSADGHKWMLGPEGAGLFYLKREHLNLLRPIGLGWNSLAQGGFEPLKEGNLAETLKPSAARYEGGTTNMSGMHGFGASLNLLLESGLNASPSQVATQILENVANIEDQLGSIGIDVQVADTQICRSGIVGLTWSEAQEDPNQLNHARSFLLDRNVVTSVRGQRLRVSTHAYNTEDDIEQLKQALNEFRSTM